MDEVTDNTYDSRTPARPDRRVEFGDLQPSADAATTADALRSGAALRRRAEASTLDADAARLTALGDLDGLGAVAKPGTAAPLVKFGRRLLLTFLRPWLAMQTIFNGEIARRFGENARLVRDLQRRVPLLEEALQTLDERLRAIEPVGPGARVAADRSSERAFIARLFVQSRLPSPPASVLMMPGVDASIGSDLLALGYQARDSDVSDADVVVAPIDARSLQPGLNPLERVGRRAARAILLVDTTSTEQRSATERLLAMAREAGWRLEECSVIPNGPQADAVVALIGIVLVRASQADAPDR